jgi:NADPH:quinone reductase-like Zn-dependent oxidoreductase
VQKITRGAGARVVFAPVGEPAVEELAGAMAVGGILFQYHALNPEPTLLPLMNVLTKGHYDPRLPSIREYDGPAAAGTDQTVHQGGLADGKLRAIVAKSFAG